MSRAGLRDLCASKRREDGSDSTRFADLRIDLVSEENNEGVLSVGGQWDRRLRKYVGDGDRAKRFMLHPGQVSAARWFSDWLAAYTRNEFLATRVLSLDGTVQEQQSVFSVLFAGGRRGGKTDLGVKICPTFSVMVPRSRVWMVSESLPKTEELDEVLLDLLPRGWYTRLGAPWFRYTLINGSTIHLRSAHDPEALKRGRADLVFLNEAQNMPERAYSIVRAAVGDTGGLVLLAANPPDTATGQWVADFYEETKAQRRASKLFEFDPHANPHVEIESLEAMKHEVDERTYRIEILGEFLARQDVVFYNWSPRDNVKPVPTVGEVTQEFCRKNLGRPFEIFLGCDFQLAPHMAASVYRAFVDPEDPTGEPLLWIADEVIVEEGTEDDLIDALELKGYKGDVTAVIADASGEWQDAERTRGRGSYDIFRKRGWRFIYTPDRESKRNPLVIERVAVGNTRMRTADGRRRLFSAPENFYTNRALRQWENKNGFPNRRSQFAHVSDAVSYPLWRFYPRRLRGKVEFRSVANSRGPGSGGSGMRRGGSRRESFDGV